MDILLEPLAYGFVLRGLAGGLIAASACAALSPFIVWRGMSFLGDTLAHSVLPGIVVAYILGISIFWGALASALLAVISISLITRRDTLSEDTAIGVVFAGFFALGILLLSRVAASVDLSHILFGNILGVSRSDLIIITGVTLGVLILTFSSYKEIITASFDPSHAAAIGLSPGLVRSIILIVLALTTVAALQTIGVVLVLALLVTPGAAASLVCRRLRRIILLSIVFAAASTLCGFYASYYANLPSGPTIVLTLTLIFLACGLISRFQRQGRILMHPHVRSR